MVGVNPEPSIGTPPDIRRPHLPISVGRLAGIAGKRWVGTAGIKGINTVEADNMTLLDDEAHKAETIAGDTLRHEETSREARLATLLRCKTKLGNPKTRFVAIGTTPVSPMLRDAILGLHRDDPLRRAYLRGWWTKSAKPLASGVSFSQINFRTSFRSPSVARR